MRRSRVGAKYDILAIVILAVVVAVFFNPVFGGKVLFFGDNLSLKLPNAIYLASRLRQGALPLWNPYLFAGLPFLADVSTALFYPFSFCFLFLDPLWALTIQILLSVFLAGLFCFFLGRRWGMSRVASVLMAFTFMFGASLVHYTTYLPLLSSSIWMPLVLLSFHRALSEGSQRWMLVGALALSVSIFGGHPQPVFYTFLLLLCYGAFFSFGKSLMRRVSLLLLIIGLALGLTAVVLVPGLELTRLTTRSSVDFVTATRDSLHPALLLRLILPNFFDNPKVGVTWGPAWRHVADNTGYGGVVALFLASLGLGRLVHFPKDKRRLFVFFLAVGAVALVLALGKYTPVYGFFYRLFAVLRVFRGPAEALLLFNFSLAVLAGLSLDIVQTRPLGQRFVERALFLLGTLCLLALVFLLVIQNRFGMIWRPFSPFHTFERDQAIAGLISTNVLVASALMFLAIRLLQRKWIVPLVALVFLDLAIFNSRYVFAVPRDLVSFASAPAETLQRILNPQWRFLAYQDSQPFTGLGNYWENMTLRPPFAETFYTDEEQRTYRELNRRLSDLALDWNVVHRLPSPNGYASFVLSDYARFIGVGASLNEVGLGKVSLAKLEQLATRYFLTAEGVVEDRKALPRARVVDHSGEPAGNAEILVDFPERVVISAEADRQATLVLADSYYPGWEATLDGKRIEIGKYQGVFRSVALPTGDHVVEFVFVPRIIFWGGLISFLTLIVYLILIGRSHLLPDKFMPLR